jgi:hypothetical protein
MTTRNPLKAILCAFSAIAVLSVAIVPLRASFRQTWSAIAATCTADEGSAGLLTYSDTGSVFIKSSVTSATAQLRCPVYPVGDMLKTSEEVGGAWALRAILRDTDSGGNSRVVVSLKSVNVATGAITTYATIDSAQFQSAGDQYLDVERPLHNADGTLMDSFFTYSEAYYVDVQLTKKAASANPGVKFLQVYKENS